MMWWFYNAKQLKVHIKSKDFGYNWDKKWFVSQCASCVHPFADAMTNGNFFSTGSASLRISASTFELGIDGEFFKLWSQTKWNANANGQWTIWCYPASFALISATRLPLSQVHGRQRLNRSRRIEYVASRCQKQKVNILNRHQIIKFISDTCGVCA